MIIAIITLIVLIFINAFFAASELAFVNLKDNKIQRMAERGDKKAKNFIVLSLHQVISLVPFKLALL